MSRIYGASSWRNQHFPAVVAALRSDGHEVYDFTHPDDDEELGFSWDRTDPAWESWTHEQYVANLYGLVAEAAFLRDKSALDWCDACCLILPAGRSAHLEAGWATASGKRTFALLSEGDQDWRPDLMYLLLDRVWRAARLPAGRDFERSALVMSANRITAWRGSIAGRAQLDRQRALRSAPDRRIDRQLEDINRRSRRAAAAAAPGARGFAEGVKL